MEMDDAVSSDYEEYTSETGGTSTEDTSPGSESDDCEVAGSAVKPQETNHSGPKETLRCQQFACYDELVARGKLKRVPDTQAQQHFNERDGRFSYINDENKSTTWGDAGSSFCDFPSSSEHASAGNKTSMLDTVNNRRRAPNRSSSPRTKRNRETDGDNLQPLFMPSLPAVRKDVLYAKKHGTNAWVADRTDFRSEGSGPNSQGNRRGKAGTTGNGEKRSDRDDHSGNKLEQRSLKAGTAKENLAMAGELKPLSRGPAASADWSADFRLRRRASARQAPPIRVEIDLQSTWGSDERMGLSELQFLDGHERSVKVTAQRDLVSVTGVSDVASTRTVSKLFSAGESCGYSGWTCPFGSSPISLKLILSPKDGKISAVKIRNYGSSLREQDIGVRDIQVRLDGRVAYKGELRRGSSHLSVIRLTCGASQPERRTQSAKERNNAWFPGGDSRLAELSLDEEDEDLKNRSPPSSRGSRQGTVPQVPKWFDSLTKSGKETQQATTQCDVSTVERKRVDDDPKLSSAASRSPRVSSARFGRRATPTDARPCSSSDAASSESSQTHLSSVSSSRTGSRVNSPPNELETSLEESWSQLEAFNMQQRGRLINSALSDALWSRCSSREATPFTRTATPQPSPEFTGDSYILGDCIIPELPECRRLTLNIRSTWGDIHYVGLNGLELFASDGRPIEVASISADPADINVLPEYQRDPRVVTNLLDGMNRTRDDMHLWLAPFTPGGDHFVYLDFGRRRCLAVLRIWNYNKSRCHSFRGARHVEIQLDDRPPFCVEIARACGGILGGTESFGDTILFTTDDSVLDLVSQYDASFASDPVEEPEIAWQDQAERPRTADADETADRPLTADLGFRPPSAAGDGHLTGNALFCRQVRLVLVSSWGADCLGLTALQLIRDSGEPLELASDQLDSSLGDEDLDRLLDGHQLTCDPDHMWLTPWSPKNPVSITVTLADAAWLSGLRVWNYNGSLEEADKGVRTCFLEVDGRRVGPPGGYLLRPGPGHLHYDFGQLVCWGVDPLPPAPPQQVSRPRPAVLHGTASDEYETPELPRGFVFQLQLISTWGDPYYIGLTELQLFDEAGRSIPLSARHVAAHPDSVNVLQNISHDVRTPDKLVDGVTDSWDGRHAWLAPLLPDCLNRIYVVFDQPQTVSMLKLWNYAKTPSRGVREFGVLVDDLVVFNGVLGQVTGSEGSGRLGGPIPHHTVLFTSDKELVSRERHWLCHAGLDGHRIRLLDNVVQSTPGSGRTGRSGLSAEVDQSRRPYTSQTSVTGALNHIALKPD